MNSWSKLVRIALQHQFSHKLYSSFTLCHQTSLQAPVKVLYQSSVGNHCFKLCCDYLHCEKNMDEKVDTVLIDLSGTLHIEDLAIDGSTQALQRLRQSNLKLKFVTNTTKEPLRTLHDRLKRLGFEVKKEEIFTSLTAAKNVVKSKNIRPLLFLEDIAKEDFEGIDVASPNGVVIGLAPSYFNYEHMNEAFNLLLEGAPLIAIHKARYYKRGDGLALGPGAFVTGLEYATDTKAIVVGKPEKTFFMEAIRELNSRPETTVMIGDDARDDIGGAMNAGMKGILVQTGKYREGDEKVEPKPTAVCKNFAEAIEFILTELR